MSRTSNTYNVRINGVGSVVGGFNKIGRSMRSAAGGANTLTRFAKNAISPMGALIATASLTAAGIAKVVGAASDLEVELVNITTLMGRGKQSTVELSAATQQLAKAYGSSSIVQARAMYQAISSGVGSATDAAKVLVTSNKLAVAGLTDVFTATDALTTVTNAYGLDASKAHGKVGDMMQKTVVLGKTTMEQLTRSLGQVAGMAGAAGLSLEEMFGFTAAGTRVLGNTSMSVVGLANMLSAITKQSQGLREESKRLGVDFSLTSLKAFGLRGMLERVRNSANYTDETFTRLFGNQRAQRLVLGLLNDDFKMLDEVLKGVSDSTGELDAATGKQMETLKKKFERLGATIEAASQSFGNLVIQNGGLKEFLDGTIQRINFLGLAFDQLDVKIDLGSSKWLKYTTAIHAYGAAAAWAANKLLELAARQETVTNVHTGIPFSVLPPAPKGATVTDEDKKFFEEQEKQKRVKDAKDKDEQIRLGKVGDALRAHLKAIKHRHQVEQSIGVLHKRNIAAGADDATFAQILKLSDAKDELFAAEVAVNNAKKSGKAVDNRLLNNLARKELAVVNITAELNKQFQIKEATNLEEKLALKTLRAQQSVMLGKSAEVSSGKVADAQRDFDLASIKRQASRSISGASILGVSPNLLEDLTQSEEDIRARFSSLLSDQQEHYLSMQFDLDAAIVTGDKNLIASREAAFAEAEAAVNQTTLNQTAAIEAGGAAQTNAYMALAGAAQRVLQPVMAPFKAWIEGAKSFDEALSDAGKQLETLGKKLLLSAALWSTGLGILSFGLFNEGGVVPGRKYAGGMRNVSGGTLGRDSVPAMLTPGERVISAPDARAMDRLSKKTGLPVGGGGQAAGGGTTVVIQGPQISTLAMPSATENAKYYDRVVRQADKRVKRQFKM